MLGWLIWVPSLGWKLYSYTKSLLWFLNLLLGLLLGISRRDFYIALAVQTLTALCVPLLNALPVWLKRAEMDTRQRRDDVHDDSSRGSPSPSMDSLPSSSSSTNGDVEFRKRRVRPRPDVLEQDGTQNTWQRGDRRGRKSSRGSDWKRYGFWLFAYFAIMTWRAYAEVAANRGIALADEERKLRGCESKHGENSIACDVPRDNAAKRRAELGVFSVLSVALVQPGPIIDGFQMLYWYVPRLSAAETGSLLLLMFLSALAIAVAAFGGLWIVPALQMAWQRAMDVVSPNRQDAGETEYDEPEEGDTY